MSKAVTCDMILTGASTRNDGSLSLRFCTPELDAASKTAFMELINRNLKVLIQPVSEEPSELHDVKSQFATKSQSQRMRAAIFVWWKQLNEPGEFEDFYKRRTEAILEQIKAQLQPEQA